MRVVHIGFPKTATTFLQTRVFPALRDFRYFDARESERFFASVIGHDDTIFDFAAARRSLQDAWDTHAKSLFSYEPLTGLEYRSAFVNRTLIAQRLRKLGFERVIITIRNQFDVLESAYRQYIRSGGVLKIDEYVTFDPAKTHYLYPEYFDYHSIYRLYAETFGHSNVLVLQYERLRDSAFLAELCDFLQTAAIRVALDDTVNASLSYRKTALLRIINYYTCNAYRPSHPISRRITTSFFEHRLAALPFWNGRRSFVEPAMRSTIASFYGESNAKLAAAAGLVLSPAYP